MMKLLIVFVIASLIATAALTYKGWEGQPPEIAFDRDFTALGRNPDFRITVQDGGTGLKHVVIRLKQNDQDVVLIDEELTAEKSKTYDAGKLILDKYKIQNGPASVSVSATDGAYRNLLRGNQSAALRDFVFHTTPPRLEVLEGQHYINQGGSECVVYRVFDDGVTSGVRVGDHFFPGYPVAGAEKGLRFALFAIQYDWPADTPIKVIARDAAGNETNTEFWRKVFPKQFRSRDIEIDDKFLQKVIPEVLSHTPDIKDSGDLAQTFVDVNSNLRKANHATVAKLAAASSGSFLWNGPFLQLSNSKVESFFADRRTYVYKGRKIDQQDHVGFDLSVVQNYPIEAANDGKVVLAEYFGIYGNTVLLDHGAGIISLYGHMSEIGVKPGQMVQKREALGKSGATGLAAGDHLHFGLFLHGVPINATEWWDEKWIREHVTDRFPK